MKVYLLEPRYWFHSFVSGKRATPYEQWKRQMIEADYTFPKAFFGYGHGIDRLDVRRWAITDRYFMWELALFTIALIWVLAKRWMGIRL